MQTPLGLTAMGLTIIFVTVGNCDPRPSKSHHPHDAGTRSWCLYMWIWSR